MNRKRRRIIGDAWADYCRKCVPHSASTEQVNATRKAFYAGALSVVSGMENAMSTEVGDPTPEDYTIGEDVAAELDAFHVECIEEAQRYSRKFGRPPA